MGTEIHHIEAGNFSSAVPADRTTTGVTFNPEETTEIHIPQESFHKDMEDKEMAQHLGNLTYGTSCGLIFVDASARLAGRTSGSFFTKAARLIPGVNIGVTALEGYNACRQIHLGNNTAAGGSAGNAVSGLASLLGETGTGLKVLHMLGSFGKFVACTAALGVVGGAMGIAAEVNEMELGRDLMEETGSKRLFVMGVLDTLADSLSMAGSVMIGCASNMSLGIGLIGLSGLVDIASLGVDYLGDKSTQAKLMQKGASFKSKVMSKLKGSPHHPSAPAEKTAENPAEKTAETK